MIGTIRKHSKWLWWVIAGLTVISFIWWGVAPANRNGGAGGAGGYGTIYGRKITQPEYQSARRDFELFYWFHNYQWPERSPNFKEKDLQEQTYIRLMLNAKADALGIHVTDDAAAAAANAMLHSPALLRAVGASGQGLSIDVFVKQILEPAGMTAADFERFIRHDLAIQQLVQAMGLAGDLITPQEAAALYQRERQEAAAQIVFFSASNYMMQAVPPTPENLSRFYSNQEAIYRLPDRVQVSYVEFNISNYFAAAEQKIGKTNLDFNVESAFRQYGMEAVPDAKTPEEAKAKIREALIRRQAVAEARQQANDFANDVVNLSPVRPENLATVAKQKSLTVHSTAPFSQVYGPEEFLASEAFTKAAFALTPDEPFAGPVLGAYSVYEIALDRQLPARIPPLDEIRDRVIHDYQTQEAIVFAQLNGTNFAATLPGQLAAGHGFASACVAAGLHPETLPPVSLSTTELPELGERASLQQLKQAVLSTPPGHASGFVQTDDGGFIVFVEKLLPLDTTALQADLPQYLNGLRRQRQTEAFNQWVNLEANRELRDTPVFQQQQPAAGK